MPISSKKPKAKLVDKLIYIAVIIEPVVTLPQAIQIFRSGNAESISIFSWLGYDLLTIVWVWYGLAHKDKAIVIYSILSAIVQTSVVVGALLYGGKWI